ncbi:YEATS-associated helix-containing protein [uncultured Dechloromonas sp.]|uniref:YEATS-associated helix-containing protein n=1 Tax=uncultured Dechloromonas sp. TaxID=171719 RepID=UPI0025CF156C|nr:YEATS-associated helix-containing protein [uncultured Dechloromonas sp.]
MLLILGVMVVMGMLGGAANYFLADRQGEPARRDWIKYPVFGVVAALTVPMFLNMISSTLLEGARTKPIDYYVFAGFCLLYVVASRRLFENMVQRLIGQIDQVRRDVGHLKQQKREEPVLPLPVAAKAEAEAPRSGEPDPREVLSYNDVEILRVLAEDSFVYGNLAAVCDSTGLARELVSQRLTVMKTLGVIETRINEKNVLHWVVSARGKAVLADIIGGQEQKKIA